MTVRPVLRCVPLHAGILLGARRSPSSRVPRENLNRQGKPRRLPRRDSMPAAKPALQEPDCARELVAAQRRLDVLSPTRSPGLTRTPSTRPELHSVSSTPQKTNSFQPRVPVMTGEVNYRGMVPVDGIISGQLGAGASSITIKQRPRNGSTEAELDGELSFKDMLRINGHIAGHVFSNKGTLIVDTSAIVEADINVATCIVSGTVVGDI